MPGNKKVQILGPVSLDRTLGDVNKDRNPRGPSPIDADPYDQRVFKLTKEITEIDDGGGPVEVQGVYEGEEYWLNPSNDYTWEPVPDADEFTESSGVLLFDINQTAGGVGKLVFGRPDVVNDDENDAQWVISIGGGGSTDIYCEIVGPNTTNEYTMQQFDNPVDRNIVGDPFTALAIQHDFGTLPNTPAGKGFWISPKSDGNFYLEPSIFYGS